MKALVVGQGLAGSCIALELISRGIDVSIADPVEVNRSTSVAAGLVNPLVLKRMKAVWRAEEFTASSKSFYQGWEKELATSWRQEVPVYRRFHDLQEQNRWMELSTDTRLESYINPGIEKLPESLTGSFGMGRVKHAYWFNTQQFMNDVRSLFKKNGSFMNSEVLEVELKRGPKPELEGKSFDLIIWANGVKTADLTGLPRDVLRPSKGELLRLSLQEDWPTDAIIKAGVFILPIGRRELRVGATYDHHDLSPGISEKGQQFLEQQVAQLIRTPYEIIGREWGIRPTTKDRRPLLGKLRNHENEYVLNGLGSRGVLMAPLLAQELAEHILENKGLRPEVDIARFY